MKIDCTMLWSRENCCIKPQSLSQQTHHWRLCAGKDPARGLVSLQNFIQLQKKWSDPFRLGMGFVCCYAQEIRFVTDGFRLKYFSPACQPLPVQATKSNGSWLSAQGSRLDATYLRTRVDREPGCKAFRANVLFPHANCMTWASSFTGRFSTGYSSWTAWRFHHILKIINRWPRPCFRLEWRADY